MKLGTDLDQFHTVSFKSISLAERHPVKFDRFHFPPSEQYRDAVPSNKLQESIVAVVWQNICAQGWGREQHSKLRSIPKSDCLAFLVIGNYALMNQLGSDTCQCAEQGEAYKDETIIYRPC